MNQWQKEVQQRFLDDEKEVLEQIEQNYREALVEINDRIAILKGRDDADLPNVIYQLEYQKALKEQIQGIINQLHTNEFKTVSEYLTNAYNDGFIGTMYDMQGQGVPLVIPINQEQVARAILHETKLKDSLYDSLGLDLKDLSKKIAHEISRGISNNATYQEMTRNIKKYAKIPQSNAARIARTEAHRIQCQAAADAQKRAKTKGADVVKQWDSTLDGNTRPVHRELDGQIKEIDEPFKASGYEVMQPGGFGDPAQDCNCRCALLTRARWALDNDFTKWDQETGGLVTIKAKDYDSFKAKYENESQRIKINAQKTNKPITYGGKDITKDFFLNAIPGKGIIEEFDRYVAPNGYTYKVDGVNVKQNNSEKEIAISKLIHDIFGGDIFLIPEVNGKYNGVKTPDYIWNKERWDAKELKSTKEEAIRNLIHKKREQAENFIIDISENTLSDETIIEQAEKIFTYENTNFVDKLMIIRDNNIIRILKRK